MFGAVEDAVGQVSEVLASWCYRGTEAQWAAVVCQLLLINRSPFLNDLTSTRLAASEWRVQRGPPRTGATLISAV